MYEKFYGLSAKPFQLSPDPNFFFASKGHKRAASYLEYGLSQEEGFIVITGEIGAVASQYGCTGCGACGDFCAHKIQVAPALFEGREQAEREGRGHPALAGFVDRFEAHSRKSQAEIRAAIPNARRPLEAQVAFLPGCEGRNWPAR